MCPDEIYAANDSEGKRSCWAASALAEQEVAADDVDAFDEADLQNLYDKGFRTPTLLARADVGALEKPPPLPGALSTVILEKFNLAALTAGPGGWPRARQAGT